LFYQLSGDHVATRVRARNRKQRPNDDPFEAIKMDKVFELSKRERFDALLLRKNDLAKSNEYYRTICPTDASEVDAKLAEAAAKKKPAPQSAPSTAAQA
jgi:NADH-quinone oxidoreductase subunit I